MHASGGLPRKSSSRSNRRSLPCIWLSATLCRPVVRHQHSPSPILRWVMSTNLACITAAVFSVAILAAAPGHADQVPGPAAARDIPISSRDRGYASEQFPNTVSVIDPAANKTLGVIRLGDPQPANLSALYRGQLLVHGLGFSPDHRTLVVVSIGSNSVTFIDTATNAIKHTTYVGRSPHEAFFTPDGKQVWVTVRGEDYVAVLDAKTFAEKTRIKLANGP